MQVTHHLSPPTPCLAEGMNDNPHHCITHTHCMVWLCVSGGGGVHACLRWYCRGTPHGWAACCLLLAACCLLHGPAPSCPYCMSPAANCLPPLLMFPTTHPQDTEWVPLNSTGSSNLRVMGEGDRGEQPARWDAVDICIIPTPSKKQGQHMVQLA
jgi:hypothetical protein